MYAHVERLVIRSNDFYEQKFIVAKYINKKNFAFIGRLAGERRKQF